MKTIIFVLSMFLLSFNVKAQTTTTVTKVYINTGTAATKYHKSRNCSVLKNELKDVKYVTLADAKKLGRTQCKKCYPSANNQTIVYVCSGGNSAKYHKTNTCRGLSSCKGTKKSMTLAEAKKTKKNKCKLCFK